MSVNSYQDDASKHERVETNSFWASKSFRRSAAATLIDVASGIAAAQAIATLPAFCCTCKNNYNPKQSAAQFTNVFCSEQCERQFVAAALASVTVEDCISIQERLLRLSSPTQAPVV